MRGKPSVWARARRVGDAYEAAPRRHRLARWAAELGTTPEAVRADDDAFAARCREAGATTLGAMCALAAAEHGLDPAEVLAEAERLMAEEPALRGRA